MVVERLTFSVSPGSSKMKSPITAALTASLSMFAFPAASHALLVGPSPLKLYTSYGKS